MKKEAIAAKKEAVLGDALAPEYEVIGVRPDKTTQHICEFVNRDNALGLIWVLEKCRREGRDLPYSRFFYRRIHEFGI